MQDMQDMQHTIEPHIAVESSRTSTQATLNSWVDRSLVLLQELLQITGEVRFLRSSGLTRRDAAAALWSCRYARAQLEGAEALGALDEVIAKLALIEIAGPP